MVGVLGTLENLGGAVRSWCGEWGRGGRTLWGWRHLDFPPNCRRHCRIGCGQSCLALAFQAAVVLASMTCSRGLGTHPMLIPDPCGGRHASP